MKDAEYEVLCTTAAEEVHNDVQTFLDEKVRPCWQIFDMYETMNDDVSCFYTNAMRQQDETHPNYFSGSANDWT
jgi:hypothetical protein